MKNVFTRLFGLFLSLLLVISLMPQRAHAASASLSASSSTLRAGNSFTVYLSVSGSNVAGLEASMSYDSSTLTYNGYKNGLGGSWVLSESSRNFTMYNSSGDTFSGSKSVIALSFTVKSGASTGAEMSVSVSGKASENGADSSFSASWSGKVAAPLSGDANLSDLWCNNATLNFTGGTEYSITVPYSVSSLDVDWTRAHSGSSASVSGTSLSVGSNTVTVTVTAENGNTKRYYIYVTREQDPNYVPSTDATLSSLSLSSGTLSPSFSPDVTDYVVYLPYEMTKLEISAVANDGKAKGVSQIRKVAVPEEIPAETVPGETIPNQDTPVQDATTQLEGDTALPQYTVLSADDPLPEGEALYVITCTAEDGTTTKDYTVHVIRMPLYAGVLPEIIPPVTEPVEPEPEPEPPAPTTYDISLPLVMTLPYIGEVTLQQAAQGALIALGVLLLILLLIAWLIGRIGGRRKALRKLAQAGAQPESPDVPLLDRLAAQPEEEESPAAEQTHSEESVPSVEETSAEETNAEDADTQESPAEDDGAEQADAEESTDTKEESPAEESEEPAVSETDDTPADAPAVAAAAILPESDAPAEDAEVTEASQREDTSEETPAEDTAEESDEPSEPQPAAEDPDALANMSLDELLEDIRNM